MSPNTMARRGTRKQKASTSHLEIELEEVHFGANLGDPNEVSLCPGSFNSRIPTSATPDFTATTR
jgi:hypothetical protein